MTMLRGSLEIGRQGLLTLLSSRMVPVAIALCALVSLLVSVLAYHEAPTNLTGGEFFELMAYWLFVQLLTPWVTMYFAVQLVHGDIEDRTFQYLFLRPVPRAAILIGKWLAAWCVGALIMVVAVLVLYALLALFPVSWRRGAGPGPAEPLAFVKAVGLAAGAYAAVACLLAARFRRPLIWSAAFIVGLEYGLSSLPPQASVRVLTVADPVRRMLLLDLEPSRMQARRIWPSARDWDPSVLDKPLGSLLFLCAVCLLLAVWVYSRTEYDSRPRE